MSISAGQIIVANDIYDKFMSDMSTDISAIINGCQILIDAMPADSSVPPIFKYYSNRYSSSTENKSIIEQLFDVLNTLETTQESWQTGPRHLHTNFDGVEASGKVVQSDFIGAYNLRHFVESLYAIAANIREIKLYFKTGDISADISGVILPFNDFALNNNDSDASALVGETVFSSQLTSEYYININTKGRQYVSNLTAVNPSDTTETQLLSTINLSNFYETQPADWNSGSDTGVVKQYKSLSGLTDTITNMLSTYYNPMGVGTIYSKTSTVQQLATANTVTSLFNECRAILNSIKSELFAEYFHEQQYELRYIAGAGTGTVASQFASEGESVTVAPSTGLTAGVTGHAFDGWIHNSTNIAVGSSITLTSGNTTDGVYELTARWKVEPNKLWPWEITNLSTSDQSGIELISSWTIPAGRSVATITVIHDISVWSDNDRMTSTAILSGNNISAAIATISVNVAGTSDSRTSASVTMSLPTTESATTLSLSGYWYLAWGTESIPYEEPNWHWGRGMANIKTIKYY